MENVSKTTLTERAKDFIERYLHGDSRPQFAWDVIIWLFIVGLIIAGVFALSVYRRSIVPAQTTTPKIERAVTISREEIDQVVQLYAEKNRLFESIKGGNPINIPSILRVDSTTVSPESEQKIESVN